MMDFSTFVDDLMADQNDGTSEESPGWIILSHEPLPDRLTQRILDEYHRDGQTMPEVNIVTWRPSASLSLILIRPWTTGASLGGLHQSLHEALNDLSGRSVEPIRCEIDERGDEAALLISFELVWADDLEAWLQDGAGLREAVMSIDRVRSRVSIPEAAGGA